MASEAFRELQKAIALRRKHADAVGELRAEEARAALSAAHNAWKPVFDLIGETKDNLDLPEGWKLHLSLETDGQIIHGKLYFKKEEGDVLEPYKYNLAFMIRSDQENRLTVTRWNLPVSLEKFAEKRHADALKGSVLASFDADDKGMEAVLDMVTFWMGENVGNDFDLSRINPRAERNIEL